MQEVNEKIRKKVDDMLHQIILKIHEKDKKEYFQRYIETFAQKFHDNPTNKNF